MTTSAAAPDHAVLVTRLLAAAGVGMPFSTFEMTLKRAQPDLAVLDGVRFGTYAGDVVYSSELRRGLDDALARNWVEVDGQVLRPTDRGLGALESRAATPQAREREILGNLAA